MYRCLVTDLMEFLGISNLNSLDFIFHELILDILLLTDLSQIILSLLKVHMEYYSVPRVLYKFKLPLSCSEDFIPLVSIESKFSLPLMLWNFFLA